MAERQPSLASSTQPQDSLCGTVVGRFRIGDRLGQGGMGEVYRAEDTKLKRTVALKRLAPSLRADALYRHRFLEEAERASRFGDAHVAAVYDVLENGGNGDGFISRKDSVFANLRLWQDVNHNGVSEAGELHTLPRLGLRKLELDYRESRRVDQFGPTSRSGMLPRSTSERCRPRRAYRGS